MSDFNPFLPSNNTRRFPYVYLTRYCPGGTEAQPCGKMYSLQMDARTNAFVSASAYLKTNDKHQTIVTTCPDCGLAIDRAWLDNCYMDNPLPPVYGRDDT